LKQVVSVPDQIGPLIKSARRAARLSQSQLARRLGISQSRMSAMELDPGSINTEQLLAMLAALDLEVLVQSRSGSDAGGRKPPPQPEW
jgi:HTH-type transcriptional regulator / antitoxin HipB